MKLAVQTLLSAAGNNCSNRLMMQHQERCEDNLQPHLSPVVAWIWCAEGGQRVACAAMFTRGYSATA